MDTSNIVHPPETVNIRGRVSIITPIGENMVDVRETSTHCEASVSITTPSKSPDGKANVPITPPRKQSAKGNF